MDKKWRNPPSNAIDTLLFSKMIGMRGMKCLSVSVNAAARRPLAARLSGRAHAFQRSITVGGTSPVTPRSRLLR